MLANTRTDDSPRASVLSFSWTTLIQIDTAIGIAPNVRLGRTSNEVQATMSLGRLTSASRLPARASMERRLELDASLSMSPLRGSNSVHMPWLRSAAVPGGAAAHSVAGSDDELHTGP